MLTAAATDLDRVVALLEHGITRFQKRGRAGKGPSLTLSRGNYLLRFGSSTDTHDAATGGIRVDRFFVLESRQPADARIVHVPPTLRRNELNDVHEALTARLTQWEKKTLADEQARSDRKFRAMLNLPEPVVMERA